MTNFESEVQICLNPPQVLPPVLSKAVFKSECQHFCVEEIPAYLPSGEGEHLFLWIRKTDVSASHLQKFLSHRLKIHQRDIGIAGQKDRRAVTSQFVSVPARCEERISQIKNDQIEILKVIRHTNKLRMGHLIGNRFRIVLTHSCEPFEESDCSRVHDRMVKFQDFGFPNYYGIQRFGKNAASLYGGLKLLGAKPEQPPAVSLEKSRRNSPFERQMMVSAVQSAIFNTVVARRVTRGTVRQPEDGDVVCRRGGIRPFLFSNRVSSEQETLVPMGPMFGPKMLAAEGNALEREQQALNDLGLTEDLFKNRRRTPGARRPMLAWPENIECHLLPDGFLQLKFDLKAGSYATVLLKELVDQLNSE